MTVIVIFSNIFVNPQRCQNFIQFAKLWSEGGRCREIYIIYNVVHGTLPAQLQSPPSYSSRCTFNPSLRVNGTNEAPSPPSASCLTNHSACLVKIERYLLVPRPGLPPPRCRTTKEEIVVGSMWSTTALQTALQNGQGRQDPTVWDTIWLLNDSKV